MLLCEELRGSITGEIETGFQSEHQCAEIACHSVLSTLTETEGNCVRPARTAGSALDNS